MNTERVDIVTSAGRLGIWDRSDGRIYNTLGDVIDGYETIREFMRTRKGGFGGNSRRWVLRAVMEKETREKLPEITWGPGPHNYPWRDSCPIEVDIPLSTIDPSSNRRLVILAENIHRSGVPEWDEVYDFWQNPYQKEINPVQTVNSVSERFELTDEVTRDDMADLTQLWIPFGWTEEAVNVLSYRLPHSAQFRNRKGEWGTTSGNWPPGMWFSGIRERSSGRLVSACMGENIYFGGLLMVEATEFATDPYFRGMNLCTAAVAGLSAQILLDTLYSEKSITPLIYSELNLTTRCDIVARKVGMTIPSVEGQTGLLGPAQVLRRNVSILDGGEPNDLKLEELGQQAGYFREAYGETYPYWRNFIAGVLSREAIDRYYSLEQCQQIVRHYE